MSELQSQDGGGISYCQQQLPQGHVRYNAYKPEKFDGLVTAGMGGVRR